MTTTDPRTAATNEVERDLTTIAESLDHVRRVAAYRAMREQNAIQAGVTLAYEVERFTKDPEAVGTDALQAAYVTFMQRHSGGFTDSAMHPEGNDGGSGG